MPGSSPHLTAALIMLSALRQRRHRLVKSRRGLPRTGRRWQQDAGYVTEWVVVTAVVIAAALAITGYIVAKVTTKAHSIDFG